MKPPSELLERLSTARFLIQSAEPGLGVGERRSREKGAGIEFADFRPYQQGDDIKHLDQRLLARAGGNYVRQYIVERQLTVTILLDASASMAHGSPGKFAFASMLAQLLGFVGLAGGDQVQLEAFAGGKLRWSPPLRGTSRFYRLTAWLEDVEPAGSNSLRSALHAVRNALRPAGLLIVISDWWIEDFTRELKALRADRHEVLALHIVSPEESDPELLGSGVSVVVDAETGEEIEVTLDAGTLDRYRAAFAERTEELRSSFARRQCRYIMTRTDIDLRRFVLRELRAAGVIS